MKTEQAIAMMVNLGCKEPYVLMQDKEGYIISSSLINVTVSVSVDFTYPNDSIFVIKSKAIVANYSCSFKIKFNDKFSNSITNWIVKGMAEAKELDMKLQLLQFKDMTVKKVNDGIKSAL
ncbi:hypothetical protein PTW35_09650 [Photobacterium sp. DA100]|uniref:hypothetical protein n=1 Tax=Photobacterium sp. DA100 TaxID=3027472 RepID=UPI002478B190|nr:hypothetical protein [Photobacterium sp. DA100]WEM40912.1 hypothetical protein PTW35_09650 [Photobacterium sp. DA100]